MTEGLVRVRAEISLPGEVWEWLVSLRRHGFYANEADAISFLLTSAKKDDDYAHTLASQTPWPTREERADGRAERIG